MEGSGSSPDEFGRVELETTGLSVGMHTIRLDAIDADDNRSSDQVQIEVVADARPAVIIEEPGDGDWFWNTDIIRFVGSATDDVDHPQTSWFGGRATSTASSVRPCRTTGATIIEASLSAGIHTVGLTAVDTDGNETTYNVTVEVRDPLDHDGDLDGFTENEGDCNDADPYTHPDAEEACDARDNDCDGDINEDWDDLEFNDTLETATDLGDIDDDGSSVRRSRGARASRCTPSTTRTGWSSTRVMTGWSTTLTSTCRWVPSRSRASTSWSPP